MSVPLEELALQLLSDVLTGQQNASTASQVQQISIQVNNILQSTQAIEVAVAALDNANNQAHEVIEIALNQIQQMLRALSIQIASPQQSTLPVRLPPTPPTGYGGGDPGLIAAAVWEFPQPAAGDEHSGDLLAGAGLWGVNIGTAMGEFKLGLEPGWLVRGEWAAETSPPRDIPDVFDVTLILSTDTSVTGFLNRVYGTGYVADHFGRATLPDPNIATDWVYVSQWGQLEFDEWKLAAFGGAAVRVPPVWPGLSGVTLGASHALVDGLTIAGPMQGVIVTIASVAPPTGAYLFGSVHSYVHVGGVIFADDNGEFEHSQSIGLQDQVLVPRTMQVASSAIFRVKSGTVGTARSWTVP